MVLRFASALSQKASRLIEYAYLLRALEGGLDGDGAGRAARAEERDGLPRYLHAAPAQLAGVAHAVGDVAAELPSRFTMVLTEPIARGRRG